LLQQNTTTINDRLATLIPPQASSNQPSSTLNWNPTGRAPRAVTVWDFVSMLGLWRKGDHHVGG